MYFVIVKMIGTRAVQYGLGKAPCIQAMFNQCRHREEYCRSDLDKGIVSCQYRVISQGFSTREAAELCLVECRNCERTNLPNWLWRGIAIERLYETRNFCGGQGKSSCKK